MEKKIIVALDVNIKKAVEIASEVREDVYAFKVGYPLILERGVDALKEISSYGKVIADLKISDIPDVSARIASELTSNGAAGVIVHGFVGRDVVRACRKVSREIYVVAEMSHNGSLEFMSVHAEEIARMAKEEGADGIVAPATRSERIRILKEISGLKVISPGVGAQGGSYRDAIENGADYVIIGRSITMADNPRDIIGMINAGT
ncbi:MAG: orotidine-5'-phosphate decarboxylase [Thermoplasmatales archaeon]